MYVIYMAYWHINGILPSTRHSLISEWFMQVHALAIGSRVTLSYPLCRPAYTSINLLGLKLDPVPGGQCNTFVPAYWADKQLLMCHIRDTHRLIHGT